MKKYFLISGMILGILVSANIAQAEDNATVGIDESLEYTYGTVVSASPTAVIINEYNYESDEEVKVTYVVNADTKFSNIAAAVNLAKDDNVDIYYKSLGGQKVATMITKDETVYENEGEKSEDDAVNDAPDNSTELQPNSDMNAPPSINETRG